MMPKVEEVHSLQENFAGAPLAANGDLLRSLPKGYYDTSGALESEPPGESQEAPQTMSRSVDLIASTSAGVKTLPMVHKAEFWPNDRVRRLHFFDEEQTLELEFFPSGGGGRSEGKIKVQLVGKPLEQALRTTEFLDALVGQTGELSIQVPNEPREPLRLAELPMSMSEPEFAAHRDRLRSLKALQEIWTETGVEIRYPANTEDPEALDNLNFVLKAIRSGWVAQRLTDFRTDIPASGVRELCDELRRSGEALRAFYFEIPSETYRVFDKQIDLGPSQRYLSAARLTTSLEEMAGWLADQGAEQATLSARWEPVEEAPLHIFFDQWPRTSLASVERDLREFETIYETTSEVFRQGWTERETWARDIPDGKRWLSLLEAREVLTQET